MMRYLVGVVLCSCSFVSVAATSEPSQDYKCHIDSAKGEKVVFYRWKPKDLNVRVASLPGRQLADSKGKKYFIKDVVECVPLSQEFTSEQSKKLDKMTLR